MPEHRRSKTVQFGDLARATGCEREPFYVRRPIAPGLARLFPVEGWYWIPRGSSSAELLAGSFPDAYYRLRRIVEESDAPAGMIPERPGVARTAAGIIPD